MDAFLELMNMFKAPLVWCGVAICAISGLVALANPRLLEAVNTASKKSIDSSRFFAMFDRTVDADQFFVRHARLFGVCALTTAALLYYQFG